MQIPVPLPHLRSLATACRLADHARRRPEAIITRWAPVPLPLLGVYAACWCQVLFLIRSRADASWLSPPSVPPPWIPLPLAGEPSCKLMHFPHPVSLRAAKEVAVWSIWSHVWWARFCWPVALRMDTVIFLICTCLNFSRRLTCP